MRIIKACPTRRPLLVRVLRLAISLMRQEAQRVSQMKVTKFEQMAPSFLLVIRAERFLQLYGVDCKLVTDLAELVEKKVREFINEMVTHHPSDMDLLNIERQLELGGLDLGDARDAYVKAWNAGPGAYGAGLK